MTRTRIGNDPSGSCRAGCGKLIRRTAGWQISVSTTSAAALSRGVDESTTRRRGGRRRRISRRAGNGRRGRIPMPWRRPFCRRPAAWPARGYRARSAHSTAPSIGPRRRLAHRHGKRAAPIGRYHLTGKSGVVIGGGFAQGIAGRRGGMVEFAPGRVPRFRRISWK